jgi:PAS domain-containing protein
MPPLTPSESNATQGDAPDAPASTLSLPEEALRASETPSRTSASASADVIYRMSPDWREMRQIDSRDFLANTAEPSENWLETYIAPEDQPQVSAVIAEAVRTGTPFELEHRVRQADGSLGWTSSRAVPVRDERGAVVEWIGAAIDITAHKAAEARLRESEERYRTLFAAMDQGLCVIEKVATPPGAPSDFRYLEANPAFLRHTGLPDPVGKTILELVPNAEPEILAAYDRVVATGKPERVEALVADIDMWMEADVYPTPEPGQIAVLFTNITERKRAEAALRASEARQAFLLQVTDAVGQQADPVKIRATATQLLAEYLDTDRAMYAEIVGETGKEESFIRGQFVRRGTPFPDRVPYAAFTEGFTHEALSSGEAVIVSDTATDPRLLASVRDAWLAADVGALIAVPLIRQGRVAIILGVQCATPRFWTPDEIELMHEVAERTWTAVEWGRAEAALRESEQRAAHRGASYRLRHFHHRQRAADRHLVTGGRRRLRLEPGRGYRAAHGYDLHAGGSRSRGPGARACHDDGKGVRPQRALAPAPRRHAGIH